MIRKFRNDTSLEEVKTIVSPPSKRKLNRYSLGYRENKFVGMLIHWSPPKLVRYYTPPPPLPPVGANAEILISTAVQRVYDLGAQSTVYLEKN